MNDKLSNENQRLLADKIAYIEKALILETRADEKFRLKTELQELKKYTEEYEGIATTTEFHLEIPIPTLVIHNTLSNVFKESGFPEVTFVAPVNFSILKVNLQDKGRGLIIYGPSGIGKTVALKEAIKQTKLECEKLSARNFEHIRRIKNITKKHSGIVIIDDFHRLEENLQNEIANYIKYLADIETDNKKLVIIGIPNARRNLIEFGHDIITRLDHIRIGKSADVLISSMIEKGELALNIEFENKEEIIKQSHGSFNIAQMLCRRLAAHAGVTETKEQKIVIRYDSEIINLIKELQIEPKYIDFLKTFVLLNGIENPFCIKLLKELAHSEDGEIALNAIAKNYPHLAKEAKIFIENKTMQRLEQDYPDYKNFLYYDEKTSILAIDDPQLVFYLSVMSEHELRKVSGMSQSDKRTKVFISYSRKDIETLNELKVYLKPLEREGILDCWDDSKIEAGKKWKEEIKTALDEAKIAILLVSADFLASDFIDENELPPLLKAAEQDQATILSVIIRPCSFQRTPLNEYQTVNPPNQPLSGMSKHDQEMLFVKLADTIERKLFQIH